MIKEGNTKLAAFASALKAKLSVLRTAWGKDKFARDDPFLKTKLKSLFAI